uniref:UDENN FNIP1/2-type domain-containing protein n=1 Tax=Glossina brevipalpis TaxID=37001 RepID=A0A1A9WCV7_9MUSC
MALFNKLFFSTPSSSTSAPSNPMTTTSNSLSQQPVITSLANTIAGSLSSAAVTATETYSRRTSNQRSNRNQALPSKNDLTQFPFDTSQVRVLVFRECDSRGRRLLFDSRALEKVYSNQENVSKKVNECKMTHNRKDSNHSFKDKSQTDQNPRRSSTIGTSGNFIEVCKEYGYRHNRPDSVDITNIGEMVFGALAMSFRGTSLKVHWLQNPARMLCSQVFYAPIRPTKGPSPFPTISGRNIAAPRPSVSTEQGSADGVSMSSFSMSFAAGVHQHSNLTANDFCSTMPMPYDTRPSDNESSRDSRPRLSSTYSTVTDSGYSASSRGQLPSDLWSSSYQCSIRSSLGSVMSDQSDPYRKLSVDFSFFPRSLDASNLSHLGSDGGLQRRISRNMITSFENENSMNDFIGFFSDNYTFVTQGGSEGGNLNANPHRNSYGANESRSNPEMGHKADFVAVVKAASKRARIGLAVCIDFSESFEEEMELFCSEHIALLESMLSRIRVHTERAYIHHKDFLNIMCQVWQDTQQWFEDLFKAPRLKCPIWLTITTSGSKYSKSVAEHFMKELCWLLTYADTKDTNFFISTTITAILTHHLGWVATVASSSSSSSHSESKTAAVKQRAKLLQVSQKHPYNALWAQMGDLFGATGVPPKLARTIIYGTEKLSIERLLNILTYFIRCAEVRRSTKKEVLNKKIVCDIAQNKTEIRNKTAPSFRKCTRLTSDVNEKGLIKTRTCTRDLNALHKADLEEDKQCNDVNNEMELLRINKKNEIPNVLAFRDSHFVQQELRIGNYLMDTGIEKRSLQQFQEERQNDCRKVEANQRHEYIKLTLTTPESIDLHVENDELSGTGALEAIEMDNIPLETDDNQLFLQPELKTNLKMSFWDMGSVKVREGLSLNEINRLQSNLSDKKHNNSQMRKGKIVENVEKSQTQQIRLSDLITQNSIGKSNRMTWGIEPIKENISLEEQMHFDFCQKLVERDHGSCQLKDNGKSVVFVLGDNEPLLNIKQSTEDFTATLKTEIDEIDEIDENEQALCPLHAHASGHMKQYSAVKFNFEQYPQIATNYMKNKNLLMPTYDMLVDKSPILHKSDSMSAYCTQNDANKKAIVCTVCNSLLNSYQTPSNATELEFETDEVHGFANSAAGFNSSKAGSEVSLETLKSWPQDNLPKHSQLPTRSTVEHFGNCSLNPNSQNSQKVNNIQKKNIPQRCSVSSVAAKCSAVHETLRLSELRLPGEKDIQHTQTEYCVKIPPGFVPSLFLSVNDHYIPDVVLQGTFASPCKWEIHLREDLALASHSASLISLPAENVAIVADMEKWDVKLLSSQSQCFAYAGGQSAPVGMSQLVSSMLETVLTMNNVGISPYECLSFIEFKLQEIYFHSETLAAFLLETDFCSLNAVTTALNLSENDVPLLLSIASIHTPQISKKCGISFR